MIAAVRGASVSYGALEVLAEVNLDVDAGAIVALVGGDGAGKSTLLRLLVGEIVPSVGEVSHPGKGEIGFLPAGSGSWSALTVRQNLDFVAGAFGISGVELRRRREQIIDDAGLGIAADRPASALSGGMRRKLGVAMAMIHRPRLLVLDEPTTGVDPVSRIDLWRMISVAAAQGAAVVMATTYLDEAERASSLVVLDEGHVLVRGDFDAIRAGFPGRVTSSSVRPARARWSWRRGTAWHEYWPPGVNLGDRRVTDPDLEDIVIALSLARRAGAVAASDGAGPGCVL